jgi:hypothetical protein
MRSSSVTVWLLATWLLAIGNFSPAPVYAAGGPFGDVAGVWTGGGSITLASGTRERLRCRGQYLVREDNSNLQLTLRCASDSYNFQFNAYINQKGGALSGHWSEVVQNVTGQVSGRAANGRVQAKVKGPYFSADVLVVTSGKDQSVTIHPKGRDLDITAVTMKLRKH